jgi:2-hydroxychromene-2-carboxylate isomerase
MTTSQSPPRLVIYGDFNCPFSALASARAAELEERGDMTVEWQAVVHDTTVPRRGEAVTAERRVDFERELDQVRDLLAPGEADRLRVPSRRVDTTAATDAYAACQPGDRALLRERLFRAYWEDGENIGDPRVVRRLCGPRREEALAASWRREWLGRSKQPIVPMMVLPDGYVSRGLGVLARLQILVAARAPELSSP